MLPRMVRARWWVVSILWLGCGANAAPPAADVQDTVASTGGQGVGAAFGRAGSGGASGGAGGSTMPDAIGASGAGGTLGAAGTGAGGTGGASPDAGSDSAVSADASAAALDALRTYLAEARDARPDIASQPFSDVALTRGDAEAAATLLWNDFAALVRETRSEEVGATTSQAATVSLDGHTLKYYQAVRGADPAGGRSLFISMHGGGNAAASTNDQQWDNQIALVADYDPKDAVWIAPRAPIDDWNMWFVPEIDPLFERLITDMIVFEGIDPNKVYVNGYSAGGDGVYQLGPRMADHWAGAAMSAGHPNDASPVNLRNIAFAIHVGGDDTAYDRNLKAAEWGHMLEALAAADPGAYVNQWQVHEGLPHWMNMEDAVAIPFVQMATRNPTPNKVVWRQVEATQSRFYWLAVEGADRKKGTEVTAELVDDTVALSGVKDLQRLTLRFTDAMLDLDQPLRVEQDGAELFAGRVARTIAVIARTLQERGDPAMIFHAEVAVDLK